MRIPIVRRDFPEISIVDGTGMLAHVILIESCRFSTAIRKDLAAYKRWCYRFSSYVLGKSCRISIAIWKDLIVYSRWCLRVRLHDVEKT